MRVGGGAGRRRETKSAESKSGPAGGKNDGNRVPNSPRLLDPHGIYGTRTANRLRVARRRRAWQNAALLALAALAFAAFLGWRRMPRVRWLAAAWTQIPAAQASAPSALTRDGTRFVLLVPTDSGRLMVMDARNGVTRQFVLSDFSLRAGPLVRDDMAWTAGEEGVLSALSWKTGRVRWRRSGRAAISTQPVSVFLPTASNSENRAPAARDSTGSATNASGVAGSRSGAPSAAPPATASRQLVIFCGNDEGVVEAIRARDGKVLWSREMRAPVGNGLSLASDVKTAQSNSAKLLLVPLLGGVLSRGGVRALDVETGREVWRYPVDAKVYAAQLPAPVVFQSGGQARVICVDDSGAVSCLDARDGRKIWKRFVTPIDSSVDNNLVMLRCEPQVLSFVGGQRVFVGGGDGGVRCFDAGNGRLLWTFDAGYAVRGPLQLFDADSASASTPVGASSKLVRSVLAVGTDGPIVWLVNAADGRPLARAATSAGLKHGVWIADQQLVVVGREKVEAFTLFNLPANL